MTTFLQSVSILLREGLEAILVIAALAAYLAKSGASHRLPALYAGAALAVLGSFAAAWAFERFYGGSHNDLVEGIVILGAAALMLYVSGWLMLRQDPRAWQAYLQVRADEALTRDTAIAVALLAFLAVFREGAETVLFVHALAKTSGGYTAQLTIGLAFAAVLLVLLFVFIQKITARLPLRALFLLTSGFLFLMALKFIGEALQEFQEQLLIPYHELQWARWIESIGLNPTLEALAAQALVIAAALVTLWLLQRNAEAKNSVNPTRRA